MSRSTADGGFNSTGRRSPTAHFLAAIFVALALASCAPKPPPPPKGYYGPTLPLSEVARIINENNRRVPTLYARHYLEGNIYNPEKKKFTFVNAEGDIFVLKPRELFLRASKGFEQVFQAGSTQDRYWLTILVDEGTMWWGYHRNAGKPCAAGMPVRADLIGEVLGIGDIDVDFLKPPVPTLRFNNDLAMYMLVWNGKLADRWYAEKEIWYDLKNLRPVKVLLFDQNGRVMVRANLGAYGQVRVPNLPREQWPWMASSFDVFFPENKSTMMLRLSDMALTSKTGYPKEGMIRFPEEPGVPENRVIQIDKDCEK